MELIYISCWISYFFVAYFKALKKWVFDLFIKPIQAWLIIETAFCWKGLFLKYLIVLKLEKMLDFSKDSAIFWIKFWNSNFLVVANSAFLVYFLHFLQIKAFTLFLWVSEIILLAVSCSVKGRNFDLNCSIILFLMKRVYFFLIKDIWTIFFWASFLNKLYLSTLEKFWLIFFWNKKIKIEFINLVVSCFLRFFKSCCWFLIILILSSI